MEAAKGGGGGGDDSWFAKTPDIRRFMIAFQRRLRLIMAVGLFVFACVVVFTMVVTPKYTANATVMLDPRKEQVTDIQSVISSLVSGGTADSSVVDTEVEVLKSRQLAERVVTALKLDKDPEFNYALKDWGPLTGVVQSYHGLMASLGAQGNPQLKALKAHEKIVDHVLKALKVKRTDLTYAIKVSFTSESPAKAALIANTFSDKYLTEQLEAKYEATAQANSWLNEHLAELKNQVQAADAAVEQYKVAHNLLAAGPQAGTVTQEEISNYNLQMANARADQAAAEAALQTAREQLARGSSGDDVGAALTSPVIQQLRAQRAQASSNLAELATKYGPRHPEMLKAQRQVADIDAQIHAEIERLISNLQAQAQVARQRTASLESTVAQTKGSLASNNEALVHLNELQRNADAVTSLYQSFLDRFKQTSAGPGDNQTDARIISRAKIPTDQSSPLILVNLALGVLLAGGFGLGAMALAETLDTGLTTAEEVEQRLDVPHLGSLPHLGSVADDKGTSTPPVEYIIKKPLSSFSEAFRAFRASIRYARVGEPAKIIALTSALPGEGKTTTAVCLGRSAAQAGDRVVIVDCDLRRRNINKLIGTESEQGLLEVLNGQAKLQDVLLQDRDTGAYFLPLAKSGFTPKDVFGSAAMDRLLATLAEHFDLVILDTAPTLAVADTRVLAAKADAVVFLARWRVTPEKAIEGAMKQLLSSGAYIAGVALTQVDMKALARYGYGDPGYYYTYYKKYYA